MRKLLVGGEKEMRRWNGGKEREKVGDRKLEGLFLEGLFAEYGKERDVRREDIWEVERCKRGGI